MGDNTYITTKVDEESDLYQRYERYVEQEGYDNKSAATRSLVESALDAYEDDVTSSGETRIEQSLWHIASVVPTFALLLGAFALAGLLPVISTAVIGFGFVAFGGGLALLLERGVFSPDHTPQGREKEEVAN